ncbi:uncharacterized protein N7477_006381 [Penicillium maclennaniae]|uniref:uncharacterized protein n=1 Tax=Penicillium maclennaniae TaxID=1343394 RepID=UPI00254017F0|nr:uncharacterized protein N7477_006381 [Penicillium maclennaniae]KAJ5667811.1 hypothetical protein N7477_006381 [Penicillium maclennaniae]
MAELPEEYLDWMEGSTISFSAWPEAQWVLDEFLGGDARILPEHEIKNYGPCYATAKFSVHHADEGTEGFIRVYRQIPWKGTHFQPAAQRSKQAVELPDFDELKAMEALKNCDVVAREPLTQRRFWNWTRPERDEFRAAFRLAWLRLASTLWTHDLPLSQKIIYDDETKSIHFAGFRDPRVHTTAPPWDQKIRVKYRLAKVPAVRRPGWLDKIEEWDW